VGRSLTGDDSGIDGSRPHDTEDFLADGVVYHESSGEVKLLDFPAAPCESALLFEPGSAFLHHLLLFGLEGRLVPAHQLGTKTPSVPLPDHARVVMKNIATRSSLADLGARFQSLADRPTMVTRARRLGPLFGRGRLAIFTASSPGCGRRCRRTGSSWPMRRTSSARRCRS
jgi:hypothetical protein